MSLDVAVLDADEVGKDSGGVSGPLPSDLGLLKVAKYPEDQIVNIRQAASLRLPEHVDRDEAFPCEDRWSLLLSEPLPTVPEFDQFQRPQFLNPALNPVLPCRGT